MPLIPSHTFIIAHTLTSLLASFALLTTPATLLSNTFTPAWMLGEAMHIREPNSKWTSTPSEPVAALGLMLALAALTQAFFASGLVGVEISHAATATTAKGKTNTNTKAEAGELGEKVYRLRYAQNQWMGLAAVRVLLMGLLVMWMYLFQGERRGGYMRTSAKMGGSGFALLANRAVFTAAMMDMLFWGYLWTNIREEGRELAVAVSRLNDQNEEDELLNS
jgi:hypothetical protein